VYRPASCGGGRGEGDSGGGQTESEDRVRCSAAGTEHEAAGRPRRGRLRCLRPPRSPAAGVTQVHATKCGAHLVVVAAEDARDDDGQARHPHAQPLVLLKEVGLRGIADDAAKGVQALLDQDLGIQLLAEDADREVQAAQQGESRAAQAHAHDLDRR